MWAKPRVVLVISTAESFPRAAPCRRPATCGTHAGRTGLQHPVHPSGLRAARPPPTGASWGRVHPQGRASDTLDGCFCSFPRSGNHSSPGGCCEVSGVQRRAALQGFTRSRESPRPGRAAGAALGACSWGGEWAPLVLASPQYKGPPSDVPPQAVKPVKSGAGVAPPSVNGHQ